MNDRIELTLSQLQTQIGNAIRMNASTQNVWVKAEMSDLRIVGGHCYMELLEKDARGQTLAKMRAMIWAGTLGVIRRKFIDATGRDLGSGIKMLVRGSATHHNLYGLSFNITDVDPSYTLGDMERLRREILERLAREGVLEMNRRLDAPRAPQRIAVISAAGAAGYGDFMNQISNNPEQFVIYTMLFGAVMQGERTAPSVMAALDRVEMTIDMWDCVVIIRGGGATTDLNGFDNYELARRVATFPLPVVVGIGHERDRTVLDDIACVRCKTPTAVAAYIIDSLRDSYAVVCDMVRRIARYGTEALKGEHLRLANYEQGIPAIGKSRVMRAKLALQQLMGRLEQGAHRRISKEASAMGRYELKIANAAKQSLSRESERLRRMEDMLRVLSPANTLKRGYSITRVNGKAVRDAAEIETGAEIETTLENGILKSKKI